MSDLRFEFEAQIWIYQGKGAWHFVTLPKDLSHSIKHFTAHRSRGWKSVRVACAIGIIEWKTSLFPYAKSEGYILPIKADIRRCANIKEGDVVTINLEFDVS
jgi:hypothetical protein